MTVNDVNAADAEATPPEPRLDLAALPEIALWVASAVVSGAIGAAVSDLIANFRRRYGRAGTDELKARVYQELKRVKRKPGVSDADLRQRVEVLFAEDER